jgi:HemX protein
MVVLFHGFALLLYLVAAGILVGALAGGRRRTPWTGIAAVCGAVTAHGAGLAAFAAAFGELPLVGLAPSLTTLAFLIGVFLLTVALLREGPPLGLVLIPLIAGLVATALLLGLEPAGEPLAFRGLWFSLHVLLSFLGCAGLATAFASGLLYLLQFRELKEKRFGRVFRFFPALGTLDRVGRRSLVIGFPALTLGLLLGWAWTIRFQRSLAMIEPQVVWGVLTWFIFVGALAARAGGAGRDRRAALASVVGFVVVVLTYLALRLFMAEGRVFL